MPLPRECASSLWARLTSPRSDGHAPPNENKQKQDTGPFFNPVTAYRSPPSFPFPRPRSIECKQVRRTISSNVQVENIGAVKVGEGLELELEPYNTFTDSELALREINIVL